MSLKDDLNKITETLTKNLDELQKTFQDFEEKSIKDQNDLLEKQNAGREKLAKELAEKEASLREQANKSADDLIAEADKKLEDIQNSEKKENLKRNKLEKTNE